MCTSFQVETTLIHLPKETLQPRSLPPSILICHSEKWKSTFPTQVTESNSHPSKKITWSPQNTDHVATGTAVMVVSFNLLRTYFDFFLITYHGNKFSPPRKSISPRMLKERDNKEVCF